MSRQVFQVRVYFCSEIKRKFDKNFLYFLLCYVITYVVCRITVRLNEGYDIFFCSFLTVTTQVRFAHTDIQVPDFSPYRRKSVERPSSKNESAEERKTFTYLMVGCEYLHVFH